ncbi:WG repeat-containing protein [Rhodopirellula europaea]|uniref:KWG Leptospira repeat protein n=1 Tax=Rhodopirellula europaea SH398 TaxID=1263868 RepID=M5RYU7_9BACT|nr:WG repeat-containing protein [Rhodopirellula europaea]EMI24371.1 KWG Leptospira repeat protein [Rhodopirellula europaea SH398]
MSDNLYFIRRNGKCGYVNRQGDIVVDPVYSDATGFADGLGCVQDGMDLHILNVNGKVEATIENASIFGHSFSEGYLCVDRNDKLGFVDEHGNVVIDFEFQRAADVVQGMAIVQLSDDLYGLISTTGDWVFEPQYNYITEYWPDSKLTAVVVDDYRWSLRPLDGSDRLQREFASTHQEREGLVPVCPEQDGKWGWVDTRCTDVVSEQFDGTGTAFFDGTIAVVTANRWGVSDTRGNLLVQQKYNFTGDLHFGRRRFYEGAAKPGTLVGGKYGFLDAAGEIAIPARFDGALDFDGDAAMVTVGQRRDAKLGWIDENGEFFWKPNR